MKLLISSVWSQHMKCGVIPCNTLQDSSYVQLSRGEEVKIHGRHVTSLHCILLWRRLLTLLPAQVSPHKIASDHVAFNNIVSITIPR
jgi:hypothetical protein